MTASRNGWDSTGWQKGETGCLWECRKQSSKCCLLISAPTTAPPVSRLADMVQARFAGVGWDSVRCVEAAGGPAENGGATNLHCWAGVQMGGTGNKKGSKKTTERTEKQDRMLIYANAVTQIWKRLVALVGSWTEAWSSHVAPRAWGNLSPLTQPVHFSC